MRPLPIRAAAVCAGLALALTSCSAAAPRARAAGEPAAAGVITTPLPVLPLVPTVRAATGDLIWVDFSGTQYLSSDGGATWERFIQEDDFFAVAAGAGAFGYYGGTDGIDDANSFYPGTDTRVVALKGWGETWHAVAVGSLRTLSDRQKIASRDKSPVTVHYWKLPRSVRHKSKTHSYAFTADSKYLVRITHPKSGSTDYATVVKASTGRTVARRKLVRSSRHLVGGASVYSLVASKSGLSVCRKPIPSGARTCTLVAAGDHRGSSATFFQQGRFSLVRDPAAATPLLVDGDRVTAVTLPASAVSWKIDGVGDPTRPLVRVVDEAGETTHLRVLADGATEEYLGDVPGTSLWTTGVALSPDTLLFSGAGQVWTQAVFASGLGDRVRHDWVQVVGASAGRWLVGQGEQSYSAAAWTVDAGEPVAELPGDAATWRISGPYVYRPGKEVRTVLGKQIDDVVPLAMFGSLVVEQVSAPAASGYEVRVRDLADADLDPVTVTLPTTGVLTSEVQLWGDWIGVTDAGVDAADGQRGRAPQLGHRCDPYPAGARRQACPVRRRTRGAHEDRERRPHGSRVELRQRGRDRTG